MKPIEMIKEERERQKNAEGWTDDHDDRHSRGELAMAAALYASPDDNLFKAYQVEDGEVYFCNPWPWDKHWDKRKKHNRIRRLQIAGALIVAEMERLQRMEEK